MPGLYAQEQRVFRDWVATCDNTRHRSLIGRSLPDSNRWIHLRFERSGEPSAWIGTMHIEFGEPLVDAGEWSLWSGEERLFVIAEGERRSYPDDLCDAMLIADEAIAIPAKASARTTCAMRCSSPTRAGRSRSCGNCADPMRSPWWWTVR